MIKVYLAAVAFGVTLLIASLVLGGKDTDGDWDGDGDADGGVHGEFGGWAPVASLRFWVFLLAFGGAVGAVLEWMGSSTWVAAAGALGVGWTAGVGAVAVIKHLQQESVSSEVAARELVGANGVLMLPIGPGKPGKVRIDVKGRQEDFVANIADDGVELPSGTPVLVVSEGGHGTLLVVKAEM